MDSVAASKRIAVMTAELEAMLAESLDGTAGERTAVAFHWERFVRRCAAMTHRATTAVAEIPTDDLGEATPAAALSTLLRISTEQANRRVKEAKDLGPRVALTGEPLAPLLSHTAAAQCRGQIGAEHVKIIRKFFEELPGFVDHDTREAAEAQLAELACGLPPEELRAAANQLAATWIKTASCPTRIGPGAASSPWVTNRPTGWPTCGAGWIPRRWACGRRCRPSAPHPGCVTPTTRTPASMGSPPPTM
jgi:uncharacterized protein DUF222